MTWAAGAPEEGIAAAGAIQLAVGHRGVTSLQPCNAYLGEYGHCLVEGVLVGGGDTGPDVVSTKMLGPSGVRAARLQSSGDCSARSEARQHE